MKIGHLVALGGVVAALTSIACSAETSTGSDSANVTSGDKKKPATTKTPSDPKASPSGSSTTPAASSTSKPPSASDACFAQCIGSNAKAKKIHDDDVACLSKCPADEGGPSEGAESGGGASGGSTSTPATASTACWDACDKQYEAACGADQASCTAYESCEDKCEPAESGSGSEGASSSKDAKDEEG